MNIKPNAKRKLTFILSGLLIGCIGNMSPTHADSPAQGRCARAVGNWAWDTRAFPATIFNDGTVVGNDNGGIIKANWSCVDSGKGIISVVWSTDFVTVDTLTISRDGKSMSGGNNRGHTSLKVIRRN